MMITGTSRRTENYVSAASDLVFSLELGLGLGEVESQGVALAAPATYPQVHLIY